MLLVYWITFALGKHLMQLLLSVRLCLLCINSYALQCLAIATDRVDIVIINFSIKMSCITDKIV